MAVDEQLTGTWTLDPAHSRLGFSTRHAMVTRVRGAFNEVLGEAIIDATDYTKSRVTVTIRVNSVDTRNADRDAHLLSADFFNVQEYPLIRFESTSVDEVRENGFIVNGNLTIRDVTRPISLPLELVGVDTDQMGNLRAGLEGTRRIDRKDWGVTWNTPLDSGGVLVSDKITLEFELSLVKN